MPLETTGEMIMVLLAAVKTLVLLLGGIITYYSLKAYRRTEDRSLGLLTAGFGVVTLGAALGGLANELLSVELATGVVIEGMFVVVGFSLIAYSLRVT